MSRRLRLIVCSVLVLVAFGAGIFAYAHTRLGQNDTANAEEALPNYFVDKDGKIRVPVEPATGDVRNTRGTADNPLFILEIVPYEGMAEFGYQIAGCEPIDVDAAARDGIYIPGDSTYYTMQYGVTFRFWPEEKPTTFNANSTADLTQYGTMTYVNDGSGNYDIDGEYGVGVDKKSATYVPAAAGKFKWEPLSAEKCFAMTAEEKVPYEGEYTAELTTGDSYKMCFENVECLVGSGNKLTHKHTFLRESVGLAYEFDSEGVRHAIDNEAIIAEKIKNYKTVVYTVTPEDLNMNPELIDRADLLVITSMANMLPTLGDCPDGFYTELQPGDTSIYDGSGNVLEKYRYVPYFKKHLFGYENPTGQYGRKENKPGATFKSNLLDWSIVLKIYERATDETHILPIVTENKIFQNAFDSAAAPLTKSNVKIKAMFADGSTKETGSFTGTQDNLVKLYMMLYQMKSSVLELMYGDPSDSTNAMFTSKDLVLANGNKVQLKNGNYLQTGVFKYDNGRPNPKKGTEESRVYWNEMTLLPWHLMPNDDYTAVEKYSAAALAYGIAVKDGDYGMTGSSAQNSIRNGVMAFFGDMKLTTGLDTQSCDVKNNMFGAQLYEFFDAINGTDPAPAEGTLTTADCLYYLLGGVNGGPTPVNNTTQYKILELQPSPSYETELNSDFWNLLIAVYTNSIAAPEVDTMTTAEFIGSRVDCISEYDLIYFGMRENDDDPTMNFTSGTDFVYAHTGPKVSIGTEFSALYGWLRSGKESGLTEAQYNEAEKYFTYSGNDLTKLAFTKLKEYNNAGFPVLFGDGFFSSYSGGYTIANTIDRNSYIYQLGNMIDDAGSKVVYKGELGSNLAKTEMLRQTLTSNSKKVQMVFSLSPVLYDSSKPDVRDRYINGYNDGNRTLKYQFYVKAPAGTSYEVKLYVDSNTDGAYTAGLEDVGATVRDIISGNSVGSVQAGKTYTVERMVEDRIGSVPWKLDLIKDGKIYASESGVSAILKGPSDDTVVIKVLQIIPEPVDPHKTYTPDDPKCVTSLTLPIDDAHASSLGATAQTFNTKIKDLEAQGLDIDFVVMTQSQVLAAMASEADYLYKNYSMLVLGFADIYKGVTDPGLITQIELFIDRGKAVLYTHDTSSGIGNKGTDSLPVWGKTVTEAYRDLFGMDRYGAKIYYSSGNFDSIPSEKDKPYIPASSSGSAGKEYTNAANNATSGKKLIQGVSDGILYRALYPANSDSDSDKNINSYKVNKVNTGAITEYPYTIPDTINIATTHPQYYQLNMEHDDIVVWYCLDGGSSSSVYENKYFGRVNAANQYVGSKNDVRNNYYIYNKGNVTYSGMGHMRWDGTENSLSLGNWEIELFINTFVAAYRASAVGVSVDVVNDDATSDSFGNRYLCVDVDSSSATEIIGIDIVDEYRLMEVDGAGYKECESPITAKSKRIYFKLRDTNSFGEDAVKYKLTMNVNGSDMLLAVYKKNGDFMHGKTEERRYKRDTVYYVDVPIHFETVGTNQIVAKTELDITVDMTYLIGSEEVWTDPKTTKVNILPRGLYDLH